MKRIVITFNFHDSLVIAESDELSDPSFTPTHQYDTSGFSGSDFQVSDPNEAYEDSRLPGSNDQSFSVSQALGEHSFTESEISQPFNDHSNSASHLSQTSDLESFSKETKDDGTVNNNEDLSSSSNKSIADIIKGIISLF